jgi:hypothetical protein
MNRNRIDHRNGSVQKNEPGKLKNTIEKGLIFGSFIIIVTALLLLPKFENYSANQQILAEKINLRSKADLEISEEKYLSEMIKIRERVENTQKSIPDSIDTGRLYEGIMELAKKTNVDLGSVRFASLTTDTQEEEWNESNESNENSPEQEEKQIKGADGRVLVSCQISVTCFGIQEDCVQFLAELDGYEPLLKIVSYDIKSDDKNTKTMLLIMESYGLMKEQEIEKGGTKNDII